MHYRREIDGLRALAVLPVILFHAGFPEFSGGFVGVDIFFVISGYLITSIILAEKQAGTFTLADFYERRARRILPALFVVMLACLPFAWLFLQPADMKSFLQSLVAVSGFVSNILFWQTSDYFETAAELKPLLHTWSLAVEEQYYVFFPAFLMMTWRLGKRWILVMLAVVALISFALAEWGSAASPSAAFFLLPTRGWELLIGAFVAFHASSDGRRRAAQSTAEIAGVIGLVLIACAVFIFDHRTPFPGVHAFVPTVGTALIILYATEKTFVGRMLGNRMLVGIGLVSYSAYLWHQPLFAFASYRYPDEVDRLHVSLLVIGAFVLAYFSWKYVEAPFRNRQRFDQRQVFVLAAAGSALFVAIGLSGLLTDRFEAVYVEHRLTEKQRETYALIKAHTGYDLYDYMVDNGDCIFWARETDVAFAARFAACSEKYGRALIVLGDSHAMNIYNAFARSNVRKFIVGVAQGGCRPHHNLPTCHYDSFLLFSDTHRKSIDTVVFHQSGAYLVSDPGGTSYYDSHEKSHTESFSLDDHNIVAIQDYLTRVSRVAKVLWLGPFIEARVPFSDLARFDDGFLIDENSHLLFSKLDADLAALHEGSSTAYTYVPFSSVFHIERNFLLVDGCLTYMDADHFSRCGESLIGERIAMLYGELFGNAADGP